MKHYTPKEETKVQNSIGISFVNRSGRRSDVVSTRSLSVSRLFCGFLVLLFLSMSTPLWADPPFPSGSSLVGDTVTNPETLLATTVSELIVDPVGTPTQGTTAFVRTADGYAILVKPVGQIIYNNDSPPLAYTILSQNIVTKTVTLTADAGVHTASLEYQGTYANLQAQFGVAPPPPVVTSPVVVSGAGGVRKVYTGDGGSNGHDGALFVPPGSGGNGSTGPTVNYTTSFNISTSNQIGIEAGSIGGKGGNGGDSYLSFWSGRDGGNGGAGGTVSVTNASGYQVATTGDNMYGIFAYSRSGQAGNGGSGFAAPGGGTGGHSSDGGSVTVLNQGSIITTGNGAYGIYGLSVSNNGGNGGSQWGLVGESGSGGFGGSGGSVEITNAGNGSIYTSGVFAHGILAQSIGGSGGSSGTSGNLILSLQGSADNGGNGGAVTVTNNGSIVTNGNYARGIFAESIGGGGGAGGFSGGLIALGGSGSNGGNGSTVTVTNNSPGSIITSGIGSDGIFAQSVGGSGGSGSDAGGLVAVGGSGSKAGSGGAVTVANYGTISTDNAQARGIVAQSIGGGGGDGGSTGGMVSVGGRGDGGGASSTVTVTNGGNITTNGADAKGILAQSIGGGGGNGGSAGSVSLFAGVAVGGTAGGGGAGGNVNVTLQGQDASTASHIRTQGDRATGLFAQSVGGGGGNGGGAVQVTGGFGVAASFAVGGKGGSGGAGGTVTLSKGSAGQSDVQTDGSDAAGVMLQSVGGGGGNGGYAVSVAVSGGPVSGSLGVGIGGSGNIGGAGGVVTVGSFSGGSLISSGFNGNILTTGERSTGFLAQSIGGGGGNGGLAVSAAGSGSLFFSGSIGIGIGGSGSGGGAGGAVSVGTQGNITTMNNDSIGLLVQSVGGGGGNGGGSIAASVAGSGGGAGTISVGIGGAAGAGSSGGQVTAATRSGTISTHGENSTGILVQSVGGGGGNGGYSIAAGVAGAGVGAGAVNVGLGGTAGGGGTGGTVSADLQSDINTFNLNSTGVLVQSIGGGGGNGGFSINAGASGAGTGSGTVGVNLGGKGGTGGGGGTVTASENGTVATHGDNSNGFVAQSIGGGGGNGGFNIDASGSGAGIGSGAISVGLGGNGGTAGNGGTVTASTSTGPVTTEGNYSDGIIAQSIGGGGGNGGFNISAAGSGAGSGSGTVSVGLGGGGGAAGNGNTVSLTVHNNVGTAGTNSTAVIAQSIGGGGGNGGFNVSAGGSGAGTFSGAIDVGLGGRGGAGGSGGDVTATVTGDIRTLLANSGGFLAQSLGGGGGNGGFNVDAGGSGAGAGSGTIGVGLGGNGGSGGVGGTVDARVMGTIATSGDNANGFVAQSIGGGGGNGGFNVSAAGSGAGEYSGAVSVGLGGRGGTGNNGGTVTAVKSTGTVTTEGNDSVGILAQSVGGGGGNGGFNVSAAGSGSGTSSGSISVGLGGGGGAAGYGNTVSLTVDNDVSTTGINSAAVIAQSIGGGGGNGGFNISASGSGSGKYSGTITAGLGGSGAGGGDGGAVTASVTGTIITALDKSAGVIAQSIGGGGGNGGFSVAGALNFTPPSGTAASLTASVGGSGGAGGAGHDVSITRIGNTRTVGDDSVGILAQSVGGGGGNGGLSVAGSIGGPDAKQLSASVGGFGGAGSEAGMVTVNNTGNILTGSTSLQQQQVAQLGQVFEQVTVVTGRNSDGILAQSIGGGGGNGGFAFSGTVGPTGLNTSLNVGITIGGFGGGGGTGDDVRVTNHGLIETFGSSANGIHAQSIGGGGGNGGGAITGLIAAGDPQSGGKAINVAVSVGGMGGSGNIAGDVLVDQFGGILTNGAGSNGILAQSIGGGGGNGGGANTLSLQLATSCTFNPLGLVGKVITSIQSPKNPSVNVQVDVGGSGGTGNDAGIVTVNNHDFITTTGKSSAGIMAQSIGGGGGNGGQAVVGLDGAFSGASYVDNALLAVTVPFSSTGFIEGIGRVTVGGFGGASGDGRAVNVTNNGAINTSGSDSYGIFAQSLGGGGGIGGNASSGITGLVSIGGFGGASGNGGAVTVVNTPSLTSSANISTVGVGASAIVAESIGGGGGNGGLAGGLLSLGGFGGAAGSGGSVSVSNDAILHTAKSFADGIFAQSVGGGGGNGNVDPNAADASDNHTGSSGISVGGYGGASGTGGSVTVTNSATAKIQTTGGSSNGIHAQSIGGGGGNGGGTGLGIVTIGGSGSGGGNGGKVTINSYGTPLMPGGYASILTTGDDSIGIFGQSIGGGGGNGGITYISAVGVGGSGGSSGNGGEVDITNTAWISTYGKGSDAIRAQSIGGGGGSAGGISGSSLSGLGLIVSVGGSGSGGGTGGLVSVDNANALFTNGDDANGIFAQSIGGGGGTSGGAIGAIAVGGSNGKQGNGGNVEVINRAGGTIWTIGSMSNGIFAQSVGGGGGNGGGSSSGTLSGFMTVIGGNGSGGGNGGAVAVDNYGLIETDGIASQAILAQSVGGGGGNGAIVGTGFSSNAPSVSVGGSGGNGGNGGAVSVNNYQSGSIVANGANSTAIFAQSVGGGGGNGGGVLSNNSGTGTASVILGGNGGDGGNGGNVAVVNNGIVQINANNSIAIMAQSVGGGGGTAGSSVGVALVPVSIGGQNGIHGTGGNVSVTNTGSIIIHGDNSVGIFAQSVGGGGGVVLPGGGASSLSLLSGGNGNGGVVTINNTAGSITVTGDNSIALYSQSVGGGGGAVGLASDPPGQIGAFLFSGTSGGLGAADDTIINQTGNLVAPGVNSIALTAQSTAPDGNGNIIVNILNAGSTTSLIEGGSSQGSGVSILNGADNSLNNYGIITTVLGVDGFAVRASTGNDYINNYGLVIGSVDLGTAANSFYNRAHAEFDSGVTVYLGAGNLLTNDGLLSPGDCERVLTSNLTGNFLQSTTGTYLVDLDLKEQIADRLNVTGTGDVSGTIAINLIDPLTAPGYALPGQHSNVLISAAGGVTDNGVILEAPNTVVATYSLLHPNATDIDLNYVIDYSPSGLTQNQHSVGTAINRIQLAQISPAFRPVATALFYQPDVATLGRIYDSLSGEGTSAVQQAGFLANDMFLNTIGRRKEFWISNDSHDPNGNRLLGAADPVNHKPQKSTLDWRAWMAEYRGFGRYNANPVVGSANVRDNGDGYGVAVGIDKQVTPDIMLGLAFGTGRLSFSVPDRETAGNVDAWHMAAYGALRQEHFYATGTLAYDHFDNTEQRHAFIPQVTMDTPCGNAFTTSGFNEYLSGTFESHSISGDFEIGYKQQLNSIEVTPFAGLQFGNMRINGFTETNRYQGVSQIGLSYNERTVNSLPSRLGLQLKTNTDLASDTVLSLALSGAWKHEFKPERSIESSFIAAPGFDFVIRGAQPPIDVLLANIGLNLTISKSLTLFGNFEYDAFGMGHSYAGMAGLNVSW